jgi:hypothetical protein
LNAAEAIALAECPRQECEMCMACFKSATKGGDEPMKCKHGAEVSSLYIHPPSNVGKQLRADLSGQEMCAFAPDELRKMTRTARQIIGCIINPFKTSTRPIRITGLSVAEMQLYRILYKNRRVIRALRQGYEVLTKEVHEVYLATSSGSDDSSGSGSSSDSAGLNQTRQTPDELGAFFTANEK